MMGRRRGNEGENVWLRARMSALGRRGGLAVLVTAIASVWVAGLCAGTAGASTVTISNTQVPLVSCASLATTVHLANTVVDSATEVAATSTSPGYCDVQLTESNPPSSDQINIGVFLPDNWNGRFQGLGGGGYSGGSPTSVDTSALQEGYATGATDTGHAGGSGSFALNANGTLNWQLIDDFSYLGIHEMTVTAKAVINDYYAQRPVYSYWNGCSTGGRQGYMEAQRYPTDYNGIYAGSPAINWAQFMVAQMWGEVQMNLAHDFIPGCKMEAAQAAAVAKCDGLDGVTDGIISDWPDCHFDARTLIGTVTPCGTITATDANVINKIMEGPRYPDGSFMWYGEMPGTNITALNGTTTAPDGTISPAPFEISLQHFVYWLTQNPAYNWQTMTYPQFVRFFNQSCSEFNGVIGTNNPNLSAFYKAGGKLLSWVGTTDQLIYPQGVIGYYQSVLNQMGGLPTSRSSTGSSSLPARSIAGLAPARLPQSVRRAGELGGARCGSDVARRLHRQQRTDDYAPGVPVPRCGDIHGEREYRRRGELRLPPAAHPGAAQRANVAQGWSLPRRGWSLPRRAR